MRELIVSKAVASTPSHGLRGVPRPELVRAAIPQRLMGTALVVPVHPVLDGASCVLERVKLMLPRTFLFEAPKEPVDEAVLLGRVGRDELLVQPIVPTGSPEPPALKDQAIVAAQDRRRGWPQLQRWALSEGR